MTKTFAVIVVLSSSLFAVNFDEFLNNALKNSTQLESQKITKEQVVQRARILTRTQNPDLELEYSQFKPQVGSNDNGYRIGISQPVRLWGVSDTQGNLAKALQTKANAQFRLSRAQIIHESSLAFANYIQIKELYRLSEEEEAIASRIYEIAKARYEGGRISRGEMLQAKLDLSMRQSATSALNIAIQKSYFTLLRNTGYTKTVPLEYKHTFTLKKQDTLSKNPELLFVDELRKKSLAQEQVDSQKIDFLNVVGAFESEPDQDIFRVGITIPLAVFNTKKEEVRIAKLEARKAEFEQIKMNASLELQKVQLLEERTLLEELYAKNERTLRAQEELLSMYEASYKIANVNLLELQNIKNKLIKTKESLIKTTLALNKNAITYNYITGAYNE